MPTEKFRSQSQLQDQSQQQSQEQSLEQLKQQSSESKQSRAVKRPEKVQVLPMFSRLPTDQQLRVFQPVHHEEVRLIVVATNIAETSITIPGITYVVDSGLVKTKHYDPHTGIQQYKVHFTSKASANQRAGRAGRTGPGIAFRLYSSAAFANHFPDFSEAEIHQKPIENVILSMKNMGINRIRSFPFPTPPQSQSIIQALSTLLNIGAIEFTSQKIKKNNKKKKVMLQIMIHINY